MEMNPNKKVPRTRPNRTRPALLKLLRKAGKVLELIAAAFMFVAVLIAFVKMIPSVQFLWTGSDANAGFQHFMKNLFTVVIGIEFLKMLCEPDAQNILETLIFLVARHMIITETTPTQDLISTFSIILLLLAKMFLQDPGVFRKAFASPEERLRWRRVRKHLEGQHAGAGNHSADCSEAKSSAHADPAVSADSTGIAVSADGADAAWTKEASGTTDGCTAGETQDPNEADV